MKITGMTEAIIRIFGSVWWGGDVKLGDKTMNAHISVGFEASNDTTSPTNSSVIMNQKAEVFAAC